MKNILELPSKTADMSASCLTYPKYLKDVCSVRKTITLMRLFLSLNAGLETDMQMQ